MREKLDINETPNPNTCYWIFRWKRELWTCRKESGMVTKPTITLEPQAGYEWIQIGKLWYATAE